MAELVEKLPLPSGPGPEELEAKLQRYLALAREGKTPNTTLHSSKDYKNPYTHERIVAYYEIFEHGSNYPPTVYDAKNAVRCTDEYYDSIALKQRRAAVNKGAR